MNKLKTMLGGAFIALLASMTTAPVMAGSGDFAGPYVAIQASTNAAVVNGSATNSNAELTNGTLGKVFAGAGIQIGWSIPVADTFLIGLDISYNPASGKISLDSGAGDSANDDITLDIADVTTVSIMPMVSITDNSAVYAKIGLTHADLTWTGNVIDVDLNSSMRGDTYALGTRTLYGNGAFLQTEFGITDFDSLKVHTKNSSGTGDASPEQVYGAVSLGFRF